MNPTSHRAFTLIELVIVVLLVSILAAIVAPGLGAAMNDIRLDATARSVVSHIRYAQSVAITEGGLVAVLFDEQGYQVNRVDSIADVTNSGTDAGTILTDPLSHRPMSYSTTTPGPLKGIEGLSASFGGNSWLVFDTTGAPTSAGSVDITSGDVVRTVYVAPGTGKVDVQ